MAETYSNKMNTTTCPAPAPARKEKNVRPSIYRRAWVDAFVKLNPRYMIANPVMFVTEVGSLLTTILWIQALAGRGEAPPGFIGAVTLWLWLCVLFANFSQALAEGRGKARRRHSDAPAARPRLRSCVM